MKPTYMMLAALMVLQSCNSELDAVEDEPTNPLNFSAPSGTIITIAGKGPAESGYAGNGEIATKAQLDFVTGVSVDASGNVFVLGGASNTIRKIDVTTGVIDKYAGVFLGWNVSDANPLQGDNGPANAAHLNFPLAVLADKDDNIVFIDAANSQIREIRKTDLIIRKLAGGSSWTDFTGDGGPATSASFNNAYGIAADAAGNIYVADQYNHVIRKINRATGIITSIAGMGPNQSGYSGDNGAATSAKLNGPRAVAVDKNGAIYISDAGNNVIRKISNGIITTLAGTGAAGYSGDGASAVLAKLNSPQALAVDGDGNIYFVDGSNNVIRKVNSSGIITTYVGTGASGYSGDGGPAIQATIANPWGIAVDTKGNLYIADTNNAAVRVVIK